MIGATGAVGGEVVRALRDDPRVGRLTLIGRRHPDGFDGVARVTADPLDPSTYAGALAGHDHAVCTLGVGQPSKVPLAEYGRVDRDGVLAFARACRAAGVSGFTLLGSVGADARSPSWYLRVKGELEDGLRGLGFARLGLFQPSMILTPTNRFGPLQGLLLALTPLAAPLLMGPLRVYRGIPVDALGRAIARDAVGDAPGVRVLTWDGIVELAG